MRGIVAVGAAAVFAAASGCSDPAEPAPPVDLGGLIVRIGEESGDGGEPAALVQGVVAYDPATKCFTMEGFGSPIVWPPGTTLAEPGVVRLPSGAHVEDGDEVSGGGMGVMREALEQIDGVTYDDAHGCFPDDVEAHVFNRSARIDVTDR
jgi:hypothetical protein